MEYIDFSNCELSERYYGGSETKLGIVYNNDFYMLKFQKKINSKNTCNVLSEFIGSNIFKIIGFETQKTILGKYNDLDVVACQDFLKQNERFIPFWELVDSSIDHNVDSVSYSYDEIILLLLNNNKSIEIRELVSSFFDIYIVDALLGNFDRHGFNWGFIQNNNEYKLSPVFDNGSCLFPRLSDDEMLDIINDEEEINRRVYEFPTSQILINGNKSSYYEVINSLKYKEINSALLRIFPKISINEINVFIDSINHIGDIRKEFYKTIIKNRYEKILKTAYLKLKENCYE